jgi:AcrR family transcriptional regulator
MTGKTKTRHVPPVPIRRPAESLPPTALKILETAKKILAREGLGGMTLDAIAKAAGVNKAATHYHFGNKAGLIEAIVDEIVLDECGFMTHDIAPDAGLEERLDSLIAGVRRMAADPGTFGGWFDLLPHALRTKVLRDRLGQLYDVWFRWNLEWTGLVHEGDGTPPEELKAMGQVVAATVDGIAIQAAIAGKDYDPEPTLTTLRYCMKVVLEPFVGEATGVTSMETEVVR